MGYYAASSGNNRRFGKIYRFYLQEHPLKMGQIGCPETSVRNYDYSLRNNPEECRSRPLRGWSLKSHLPDCTVFLEAGTPKAAKQT